MFFLNYEWDIQDLTLLFDPTTCTNLSYPNPSESHGEETAGAISLNDFELIRVIGRGSYAKVLMVELKKTKRIYAMKVIKKELVTDDEVTS